MICSIMLEECTGICDPTGAACWKKRAREAEALLRGLLSGGLERGMNEMQGYTLAVYMQCEFRLLPHLLPGCWWCGKPPMTQIFCRGKRDALTSLYRLSQP